MDQKVSKGIMVMLNGICALAWNVHVVIDFVYGFPNVLHIVLAIAWDVIAVVWVLRYLKSKKNSIP